MQHAEQTRRAFLATSVLASAGVGLAKAVSEGGTAAQAGVDAVSLQPGEKLRIAILGCGNRSAAHIQAINQSADKMEVAALCDILPEKLEEKKRMVRSGTPQLFSDYHKMLEKADIHAVAVVLPNTLHRAGAVASLEAGKHVLCEKPLSMKLADARAIVEASDRTRRIVQVSTQTRHSPAHAGLAAKLREGLIGPVLYGVVSTFRADWRKLHADPQEDSQKNWRMKQEQGGSVVFEMGIHLIDIFNWFIGSEPVEVTCMGGVHNPKLQKRNSWDHAGIVVRYANGALMTYGGNLYSCGGAQPDLLFGQEGTLQLGAPRLKPTILHKCDYRHLFGEKAGPTETQNIELPSSRDNDDTLQYRHFYEAVQGRKPAFPSAREHLPAILIARAAQMSQEQGRHIKASEVT